MQFSFSAPVREALKTAFGHDPGPISFEACPPGFTGDLTLNCFHLAKALRRSPMQIAQTVGECLTPLAGIQAVEVIKAFANVTLEPETLFEQAVSRTDELLESVRLPAPDRRSVLIEFSAPNTNKPQHLGHVRNNTIGMVTVSLLRRVGHTVHPVNLVNDRGIHICKSMVAYRHWGAGRTPAGDGVKGDHFVGDFYVRFDTELRAQIAQLREARPELVDKSSEELFLETEIGREAQQMLVDWEKDDPEVRRLWTTMNGWVLEGFEETYRRMGVSFDRTYLESNTYTLGRDIIMDGLERGVFERAANGAVIIDLSDEGLDTKVVLRSDGTSVYVTQDIGTTILKQQDFEPDQQIWVVGDEQNYHFRVLFAILRRLGYAWADQLHHMAYGMVNLPSGRMKSREGTVVDADDLFDEMTRLAREATLERAADEAPADLEERATVIGMAALKFMLLKVNPRTTILFDPQASIRFEGDTGPYVLYAYARICSMMRKAEQENAPEPTGVHGLGLAEERELALACLAYPDAVRKAAAELDASGLANYLLDLAKAFSRFYRACPVLGADTDELVGARLALSRTVQRILADGLHTLTLGTLESM